MREAYCSQRRKSHETRQNLRLVVQKVMGQIIADVAEYSSAVNRGSHIPIVGEHKVGKMPKWSRKDQE